MWFYYSIFYIFAFLYVYCFQYPLISKGVVFLFGDDIYVSRVLMSVIIVVLLFLVQKSVSRVVRNYKEYSILQCVLAAILLVVIVNVSACIIGECDFFRFFFIVLVLLFTCCYNKINKKFKRVLDNNFVVVLLFSMLFVCFIGNANKLLHGKLNMQMYMSRGEYEKVLSVVSNCNTMDVEVMDLRVKALSKQGKLGERLFEYPLSHTLIYNAETKDEILTNFLLAKDLDGFTLKVKSFYPNLQTLPKHFREALVLYNHIRSNPIILYKNNIMDADFEDLQYLDKQNMSSIKKNSAIRDVYGKTYWYYYLYV